MSVYPILYTKGTATNKAVVELICSNGCSKGAAVSPVNIHISSTKLNQAPVETGLFLPR